MYCYILAAPRLACVRPVASVHPEPGSNSSLYILPFIFSFISTRPLSFFLARVDLYWRDSYLRSLYISLMRYIPFCTTLVSFYFSNDLFFAPGCFPVCGCKGTAFLYTTKLFRLFFSSFFEPFLYLAHFVRVRDEKNLPFFGTICHGPSKTKPQARNSAKKNLHPTKHTL